jgi:hypothetical protein
LNGNRLARHPAAALRFGVTALLPWALPSDKAGIGHTGNGGIMSLQSHLEALRERHAFLETRIADEDQRPRPDAEALTRLKLEKLRLKDEMERLRNNDN